MLLACGGNDPSTVSVAPIVQHGRVAQGAATAADYSDLLQRIYVAYFGRPSDPAGLAFWTKQYLAAGLPSTLSGLVQTYTTTPAARPLVDMFGTSQESQDLYGGDNDAFITAIYLNMFGRQPDAAGKAYWLNLINTGAVTRPIAALSIMAGAQAADGQIIENKIKVASNFTTALNSPERNAAYDGLDANVVVRKLLNTVNATTNVTAFQTSLDDTIAALVTTKAANTPVDPATPLTSGPALVTLAENVDNPAFGLTKNGELWGWGDSYSGMFGDGQLNSTHYQPILIGTGYASISTAKGGGNTSAIKLDGTLLSWGTNSHYELGDGTTINRTIPTQIGSGYKSVSTGYGCSYGIKNDTSLWAWGFSCGSNTTYSVPKMIGTGFSSVASDAYGMVGIKTDGTLYAWGSNNHGRIQTTGYTGNNYKYVFDVPTAIGSNFKAVTHTNNATIALKADGTLWGWGNQYWGEVGNGVKNPAGDLYLHTPVQIGQGYTAISGGTAT
ncbi:DUF4214 domain-containing protein [Pseudoduganella danionis]|uniref:DUF4214 domain-containing protein n=1 Tax=Pseudoduganella danionis TaxID=1890295 RepID=UPI003609AE65